MKLIAHQAVYGDVNGAHALIAKSSEARSPFFELIHRTDRPPGHLPPNLQWQPYVSGYPFEDRYVLTKTFQDETASRSGMVITNVLVFNLEEFISVEDLNPALRYLPATVNRNANLADVKLEVADEPVQIVNTPGLATVVRLLLQAVTLEKPVVWMGQDGFEPIITALWRGLWPSARKSFKFRLSFTPQDVEGQELTIVCVPLQMENRWSGFPVAHLSDVDQPQTKAEAFLMGKPEGEPLRALFRDLQTEPVAIADLQKLQASSEYLESIEKGTITINAARSLARLLGALSKSVDQAANTKTSVLRTLMELTANGSASDVQALNNLDLRPFKTGVGALKQAVDTWFKRFAFVDNRKSAEATADMISLSFATSPSHWTNAIHESLRDALNKWSPLAAVAIWRWWQRSPSLVISLQAYIPASEEVERDLATETPAKLTNQMADSTRVFAIGRGWRRLHAAIVASGFPPAEAFLKQLEVDSDLDYFDGLRVLSVREPADVLIAVALEASDPRLLRLSGEACYANPELLSNLDVENEAWRSIWLFSIEAGNHPWAGIANPRGVIDALIGLVIDRGGIGNALLRHLSKTEFADLSSYDRRAAVWNRLQPDAREGFIEATANGWLQKFRAEPTLEEAVEPQLEQAIISPERITKYFNEAGSNIAMLVNVFRRFHGLTAAQFEQQLNATVSNHLVNSFDAILVGKLIMERRWRGSATTLSRLVLDRKRDDLIPALQECQSLLGWVDSAQLWLSGRMSTIRISSDDWWNALRETAVELYPYGPEYVWGRAGGEASVINRNQSGLRQWDEALLLLRNGGGGENISLSNLLSTMRQEYRNNQKLLLLQQWHKR